VAGPTVRAGAALLAVLIAAGCGGGESDEAEFQPLPLTRVHEWAYADVGLPDEWGVTGDLPGGFQVASEAGLVPGRGLEPGQVQIMIGYLLNAPSLDVPLAEELADTLETWGLEQIDAEVTTMLGHPTEIVTAAGERFARFEARVVTGPDTAFFLSAYVAPDELERHRPTLEAIIESADLKGLLAEE
jgi:hypothetical protein